MTDMEAVREVGFWHTSTECDVAISVNIEGTPDFALQCGIGRD
jgi:hypothetical protein